jgi:hypothetical protein
MLQVNPDTLYDEVIWPYRDLQRLCKKLEIGGKGSYIHTYNIHTTYIQHTYNIHTYNIQRTLI